MVRKTLGAIANQSLPADRFEVIVVDNNTADPDLYIPVSDFVAGAGSNWKFIHFDILPGAKAGALNQALSVTSDRATHIITVDADYQVRPRFLERAEQLIAYLPDSSFQFPQAYRNVSSRTQAIADELGTYFSAFPASASISGKSLLTGTMSVIRRAHLDQAGGWPTETITEDADLGARIIAGGGSIHYIPEAEGYGLLPLCLKDLSKQRLRWTAGNVQVLLDPSDDRGVRASTSGTAFQLMAWSNCLVLLPLLAALTALVSGPVISAVICSLLAIAILAEFGPLFLQVPMKRRRNLQAALVRLALLPEAFHGLVQGLSGRKLTFRCTPKDMAIHSETTLAQLRAWSGVVLLAGLLASVIASHLAPLLAALFYAALLLSRAFLVRRFIEDSDVVITLMPQDTTTESTETQKQAA